MLALILIAMACGVLLSVLGQIFNRPESRHYED